MRPVMMFDQPQSLSDAFQQLGAYFAAPVTPKPVPNPRLAIVSPSALALLDWPDTVAEHPEFLAVAAGAQPFAQQQPLAMVYAGHQFGGYSPQLGDGRGVLLAQVLNSADEQWDIHLKGAGLTPFSRSGDGRAVLRSCLREFLGSEYMHALGIATTRALAVVASDELVWREVSETAATLLRVTRSHIRFGHFEFFYYSQQYAQLHELMDYVLAQHYPECQHSEQPYAAMFAAIAQRTAQMIAYWQAYGFCHGVMNTDNMSVLGETFDYGPYAFLEDYRPDYRCNRTDCTGRYAFNQQVDMGEWNLTALGQTFTGRVELEPLRASLAAYRRTYQDTYLRLMAARLGWQQVKAGDEQLIEQLLSLMQHAQVDYHVFFRQLSEAQPHEALAELSKQWSQPQALLEWGVAYQQRTAAEGLSAAQRQAVMQAVNPVYVLRNYLMQEAIEAARGEDFAPLQQLYQVMQQPFTEQAGCERYAQPAPPNLQGVALSCSS